MRSRKNWESRKKAAEQKIKIYTVGIGSDQDAKIPVGPNMFGVQRYQVIPGGSVDEKGLQEIAKITNGRSFMAAETKALQNVLLEINKLERTQVEHSGKVIYEELYFKFLLRGIFLFVGCELLRRIALREGT